MAVTTFTLPYVGTPPYFSGSAVSSLVPSVFPVAIDGRPYMVDQKSGRFVRNYEQRIRDSQDISTAPGESSINPGGLWRRGQDSWHYGAGQQYADTAESKDFMFYKSKGINPWTKGQLSLLNTTKVTYPQSSSTANVRVVATDTAVFITDNSSVKYTTDPFVNSPTWVVVTGLPALTPRDIATDGTNVFLTYAGTSSSYGIWKINSSYTASNYAYGHEFGEIGYAKGRLLAGAAYLPAVPYGDDIYYDPTGNVGSDSDEVKISPWEWIGFAGGQNAIYAAGHSGDRSVIFKITQTTAGTLDKLVAALELPKGEIVSAIHGYLGYIILGTNKGVRYCTTDNQSNLVAGPIIPTTGPVYSFTSEDKYVWFTWSAYDTTSGGLGRLDLSTMVAPNQPAYATDLMYDSVKDVLSCTTFNKKRLFTIKEVGLVVEDSANLVASGELETGTYRWGIPDRKFAPRFDIRVQPLVGSVSASVSFDSDAYASIGTHSDQNDTEHTFLAPEDKFIEAAYKLTLTRQTATTGPTLSRWMSRAYAAPSRSRLISVPVLLHTVLDVHGKDYFMDVAAERDILDNLVSNPRIVTYQERGDTYSVIVEDIEWQAVDASSRDWLWEGTATVIMRTVTE